MRASDADRERAATALREHHAAGRIEDDELEERLAVVLAARTLDELHAPFSDLTPPPPPPPLARTLPSAPTVDIGGWGNQSFRQRHAFPKPRPQVWRQMIEHVVPSMAAYGYTVVDRSEPEYMVFEIEERAAWPWLFIGLLAFFMNTERSRVVVSLTEPRPGHTEMTVTGTARRPVRKAFAGISADG